MSHFSPILTSSGTVITDPTPKPCTHIDNRNHQDSYVCVRWRAQKAGKLLQYRVNLFLHLSHTPEEHSFFPPSLCAPYLFVLGFRAGALGNFWVMTNPNAEEQQDSQKNKWQMQT
jgi:hypothetical protein